MAYTLVQSELIADNAITSAKLDTNIAVSGTLNVTGVTTLATHLVMGDNDKIKIGTGGDLEIYHDASNSYIVNSTGNLYIGDTNGNVHIQAKLNEDSIVATADGAVTLFHNNVAKLATASAGVTVTGALTSGAITSSGVVTANAGVVVDNFTIDGTTIALSSGDMTLDVTGAITLDSDSGVVDFKDGGTHIGRFENASSDFKMESRVADKDIVFVGNDSGTGVEALRLDMSAAGKALFNSGAAFAGNVDFADNAKIVVGSGDDLQIHHDGSNSYIAETGTGDLIITSNSAIRPRTDAFVLNNAANNENMITAVANGAVILYHNASPKLTTTATGVTITGGFAADAGSTITQANNTSSHISARFNAGNRKIGLNVNNSNGQGYIGSNVNSVSGSANNTYDINGKAAKVDFQDGVEIKTAASGSAGATVSYVNNLEIDQTGAVFNEGGIDIDFRVESDGNANMLFVDGGTNRVGIGTSSPTNAFSTIVSVDADFIAVFRNNEETDGRNYGLNINAGSTSADLALSVVDHDGSNVLFRVKGNGDCITGGDINIGGASNGGTPKVNLFHNDSLRAFIQATSAAGMLLDSDGKMSFNTNNASRWHIQSSGHLTPNNQHAYDIGATNAEVRNIYAQGLFIGGSGTANKLDDYEEGTWTPASISGISLTVNAAVYTKIGRVVHIGMAIVFASNSNSAAVQIAGLPFPVRNQSDQAYGATIANTDVGRENIFFSFLRNSSIIGIGNSSNADVPNSVYSGKKLCLSGFYFTDA